MASLPFPRKCAKCRERKVVRATEEYHATLDHDGRSYEVVIPDLELLKCEACGNRVLDDDADDRLSGALRAAVGLLSLEEIRSQRKKLGFTQVQMAERLQVAEATLCRWETGAQIQQRHSDLILRAYFECPEFRQFLELHGVPKEGKKGPIPFDRLMEADVAV